MTFRRVSVLIALLAASACVRQPIARNGAASPADTVDVRFETTRGPFVVRAIRPWAPIGVDHFLQLVRAGYFDDSRFSRVVPNFIAQFGIAGDPAVTSIWKDHTIADDPVRASNVRGTIGFAMTGPNTRTTQLYISLVDNSRLDAQGFAPIGRVIEGMSVVDSLYNGYGENSGGGMRAGHQGEALAGGNAYFDSHYPKLDHLVRATVVRVAHDVR